MAFAAPSEIGQPPKVSPDDYVGVAHTLLGAPPDGVTSAVIADTVGCRTEVVNRALLYGFTEQGLAVRESAISGGSALVYRPTDLLAPYLHNVNEATARALVDRSIGRTHNELTGRAALVFAAGFGLHPTPGANAGEIGSMLSPVVRTETVIWFGLRGVMAIHGISRLHGLGLSIHPATHEQS